MLEPPRTSSSVILLTSILLGLTPAAQAAEPTASVDLSSASAPAVISTPTVTVPNTPSPAPTPEPEMIFVAMGDIRLDGPEGRAFAENGPSAPASAVRRWLEGDVLFGNLETSVSRRGAPTRGKTFTFRAPPENIAILRATGFTVLNLANNHVMDYGPEAFLDTLRLLDEGGFRRVGAGRDLGEAVRPVFFERGGLRVGLLAFTSTHPEEAWARRERPGVAYSGDARVPEWIRLAKSSCDVLLVSFHGGTEKAEDPNEIQRAFGRLAVDAGADAVIGHHPHVLQAVELYKGRPILHSIGNGLFVSPTPVTRWSALARIRIGRRGVLGVEFVPTDTWSDGRLRPAPDSADIVRAALDRDGTLSAHPELFRLADPR
ncbi:MAG: CapA family protein [Elusimicrobiota bacterium]